MSNLDTASVICLSRSPEFTQYLGREIGKRLQPGDVICLLGDLGAGKTTLAQGVGAGWGAQEAVNSPTFVLVNEYSRADGMRLYHVDAYRLHDASEAESIALDDLLNDSNSAMLIEWAERVESLLPVERLWISLSWVDEQTRQVKLEARGERYLGVVGRMVEWSSSRVVGWSSMILAIDTATRSISVALAAGATRLPIVLAEFTWLSENNHTTELAPSVERVLLQVEGGSTALKAVAVCIGPGSFTGVRIGLAFAKGLALARGLPLIGVRSFEIAVRALPVSEGEAIAVAPAGRGRVIWGECSVRAGRWEAASNGAIGSWVEVAGLATDRRVIVGEIDSVGENVLQANKVRFVKSIRQARHLAEIGWERLGAGQVDSAATLAPIYAHQPKSGA